MKLNLPPDDPTEALKYWCRRQRRFPFAPSDAVNTIIARLYDQVRRKENKQLASEGEDERP